MMMAGSIMRNAEGWKGGRYESRQDEKPSHEHMEVSVSSNGR